MAVVIHNIKGNDYAYEHHRVGKKIVCDYLGRAGGKGNINEGTPEYRTQSPEVTQQEDILTDPEAMIKYASKGKVTEVEYVDKIESGGRGAIAGSKATLHKDRTKETLGLWKGDNWAEFGEVRADIKTAAHEGTHAYFSSNPTKGHIALKKFKEIDKKDSQYPSDNTFEELIDAGAIYHCEES